MAHRIRQAAALGFLLFLALFAAGVARTYALDEPDLPDLSVASASYSAFGEEGRKPSGLRVANNLAQVGLSPAKAPLPQVLDKENVHEIQVYERTAHLGAATASFAEDEARARVAIDGEKATVFNEQRSGVAPHRRLTLGIAVRPDRFDALLRELQEVGRARSINVRQEDRTEEFRKLHAQRQSLKKYLEAILKLRGAGKLGVDEALKLEAKIQEIEKESQAVAAQLGELLGREPSYNLFVQLDESAGAARGRGFTPGQRVMSGLLWAAGWWMLGLLAVAGLAATALSIHTLKPRKTAPPPLAQTPTAG